MSASLKRSLLSLVVIGLAINALAPSSAAAALDPRQPAAAGPWDLEAAFLAHPDMNPVPDGAADVWHLMSSHRPALGDYLLLPTFTTAWGEAEGLEGWLRGSDPDCWIHIPSLPVAFVNTTLAPLRVCGIARPVPVHAVAVHPSFTKAVVGWRSPVTGTIAISGTVEDFDGRRGNGVKWSVRDETDRLAAGRFRNHGSDTLPAGLTTSVTEGEFIYLVVRANGDWDCDLTGVTFSIESLEPDERR